MAPDRELSVFARALAEYAGARRLFQSPAAHNATAPRVLVALSGGPDSCALLLALTEAADAGLPVPRPIASAHFHHGLRGEDADEDARFAADLSESLGIECRVVYGSVPKQTGRSPNDAARRARYAFLEETARQFGATHLATGHNADDQAETVLGRVLRGTSVDGLAGIPPRRNLSPDLLLVRPLLSQRRAEIEAYCAARSIVPRRDPSNEKERYARSRLRKRLPELAEAFNPQLVAALERLAIHAATDSDYLNAQTDSLWQRTVTLISPESIVFDAALLSREHPALSRRVLLRGVHQVSTTTGTEENAATAVWVDALESLLHKDHGSALTLPGTIRAERTPNGVILYAVVTKKKPTLPIIFSIPLQAAGTVTVPWANLAVSAHWRTGVEEPAPRLRHARVIDMAIPMGIPLAVRPAKAGERMTPLGMAGKTRLIRDLLADARISASERDYAPVVVRTDTEEILWLVGIAQVESTRVMADTETVLRLSVSERKALV